MKVLIGIIFFHLLVIIKSKMSEDDEVSYISVFFLSLLLVLFVVYMMFTMEEPIPYDF